MSVMVGSMQLAVRDGTGAVAGSLHPLHNHKAERQRELTGNGVGLGNLKVPPSYTPLPRISHRLIPPQQFNSPRTKCSNE